MAPVGGAVRSYWLCPAAQRSVFALRPVPRLLPVDGSDVRRIGTWALLGLSLAGALLFVVVRVTAPSDGGRIAFYQDSWSALGVVISPIDAPQPGLQPDDRVEAIDGRSMESW